MPEIIKNGRVQQDDWQVVRLAEDESGGAIALPAGRVIVPLGLWLSRREALLARAEAGVLGVWLAAGDDPAALAPDLLRLQLVAVDFPKFADGRGYSIATLLRTRYGYAGELRAIGEVLRDQFDYLGRCGFDALQPAPGRYTPAQLQAALASLATFGSPYQASATLPQPLFRRVTRPAARQEAA